LGYKIHEVEKGYYADGEDAYSMRCVFNAAAMAKSISKLVDGVSAMKLTADASSSSSAATAAATTSEEETKQACATAGSTQQHAHSNNKHKKNKKKK
jgi:hypothetical protein